MIKIQLQSIKVKQIQHTHLNNPTDLFCSECGETLYSFAIQNEWVCEYCRRLVNENDKFCPNCGDSLTTSGKTERWCFNNELDKEAFTNLVEALKLSKEDVK